MNLGRILGVVLSVFVAFTIIDTNLDYQESKDKSDLLHSLISDETRNVESIENQNMTLSSENSQNTEVSEYKNNLKYAIDVKTSDVKVRCNGNSIEDIELAESNIKINALFSKNDNNLTDKVTVNPGETIKIHVNSEYVGSEYPVEEVVCNFSLNIDTI